MRVRAPLRLRELDAGAAAGAVSGALSEGSLPRGVLVGALRREGALLVPRGTEEIALEWKEDGIRALAEYASRVNELALAYLDRHINREAVAGAYEGLSLHVMAELLDAMGNLVLDNLKAHFAGQPLPTPVV